MPTVKTIKIIIAALLIGFFLSIQHLEPIPVMWKRILRVGNNWCILVR
jgi:hypothetical protein